MVMLLEIHQILAAEGFIFEESMRIDPLVGKGILLSLDLSSPGRKLLGK